jgi:hypothetical protein
VKILPIQCNPAPTNLGATDRLAKALCETFTGDSAHSLVDGLFTHPYEQIFPLNYQEGRPYFYDHIEQTENGQQPQIYYWRTWGHQVPQLVEALVRHGMEIKEKENVPVSS